MTKYTASYSILIIFLIFLGVNIFVGCRLKESDSNLIHDFAIPDQSTPERTLRTFLWGVKNAKKDIVLSCVDSKKVAEGRHGRDIDELISELSKIDISNFRFLASDTRVSIESPHYCMDYDMEKRENDKWVIVSIHP